MNRCITFIDTGTKGEGAAADDGSREGDDDKGVGEREVDGLLVVDGRGEMRLEVG